MYIQLYRGVCNTRFFPRKPPKISGKARQSRIPRQAKGGKKGKVYGFFGTLNFIKIFSFYIYSVKIKYFLDNFLLLIKIIPSLLVFLSTLNYIKL